MGSLYPLTGQSILVVEDEPLIALEIAAVLRSAGARVCSARNAAQARIQLAQGAPHAVVLDYALGDDDATKLCTQLAEHHIPFMLYSGYPDLQEKFPKRVVVPKPATGDALLSAVAAIVCAEADRSVLPTA
jgi:DNA-binding response OmpR family regulator